MLAASYVCGPADEPRLGETISDNLDRIAHYKIPRYLRLTDDFPMTVTGKVQKFKLREISIAEVGLEHAAAQRTA